MSGTFWTRLALFAEGPAEAGGEGNGGGGSSMWTQILMIWVPIGFLFYYLLIRPQRVEQARRVALLRAVKPNDRVLTAGGIYGVVTNVHREADMVTIKVDESTGTKLRVSLAAIARVLLEEPPAEPPQK